MLTGRVFKETLMCSRTVCSRVFTGRTSFTEYPSTVTFYEVRLQLLWLHNFQKRCRNSRLAGSWSGAILPSGWRGGHQSRLSPGTKALCLQSAGVVFLFIYIPLFFLPSNILLWLPLRTQWGSPKKIQHHIENKRGKYLQTKCKTKSEHSL